MLIKRKAGFSLIEIMFVIVLIAIITTVVVSSMQNRILNASLNKAAGEMELILQAASAYYSDNRAVPKSMSDLQKYLTIPMASGKAYGPWGQAYTISAVPSEAPSKQQVSLKVPTDKIGQGLASILPGSSYTSSNTTITASTPLMQDLGTRVVNQYAVFIPNNLTQSASHYDEFRVKRMTCPAGYAARASVDLPYWQGLDKYNYYIKPYKQYGYYTGNLYYAIDHFKASIDILFNPVWWQIRLYYVITLPQSKDAIAGYNTKPFGGTDSQEKVLNTAVQPPHAKSGATALSGDNGYFGYLTYNLLAYRDNIFVGKSWLERNQDALFSGPVTSCANPICDPNPGGIGPHTPTLPAGMTYAPPNPGNTQELAAAFKNGYIGQLTLTQWCEKCNTVGNINNPDCSSS